MPFVLAASLRIKILIVMVSNKFIILCFAIFYCRIFKVFLCFFPPNSSHSKILYHTTSFFLGPTCNSHMLGLSSEMHANSRQNCASNFFQDDILFISCLFLRRVLVPVLLPKCFNVRSYMMHRKERNYVW